MSVASAGPSVRGAATAVRARCVFVGLGVGCRLDAATGRVWPGSACPESEGHGQSDGHSGLAACGIDDYVGNVRQIVATLPEPPVLVGHSMGGFVVQRYLELGHEAAGVVLLASVPPRGLTRLTLNLLRQAPDLLGALQLF